MIFFVQFGINKHLKIFQRPQSFWSLKNLLVLIYSTRNHVITYTNKKSKVLHDDYNCTQQNLDKKSQQVSYFEIRVI